MSCSQRVPCRHVAKANRVWLTFALVVLWTAFPGAFAAVVTTLCIPLTLAAFGMIARAGVASGRVPAGIAAGDVVTSWVNPTSVLGGVLAVLACAMGKPAVPSLQGLLVTR